MDLDNKMNSLVTMQPTDVMHQRAHRPWAYVKEVYEEQDQRHCLNQSQLHQFGAVSKLMGLLRLNMVPSW
jgi:hypothetical protein